MIVPLAKAKVSIVTDFGDFKKGISTVKRELKAVAVTTTKNAMTMNKAWKNTGKVIENSTKHLTGFKTQLLGLGAVVAAKKIAGDFLMVAESFEAMEIQLDTLTRGRGKETLHELNQWALDMPVNTQKAVDSFRLMTAMGINPTIKTLETLTDVASIFGDDVLNRLALQLGQASAKGKIMAQDLNIMAEAGINARKFLKDAYGMTVEEIQKSSIDINDIIKTIFAGMDKEFGGSAKKMMGTWRGLKTVTKSYFVEIERSIMAAGVFDELKKGLSAFNDTMKDWLDNNRELINQDVPKYIEKFKDAAESLWKVLSYDPAIIEYGLLGLAIGGKKGAVMLGGLAHLLKAFSNTTQGISAVIKEEITFLEFADLNFKELSAKLKEIEGRGTTDPRLTGLREEIILLEKSLKTREEVDEAISGSKISIDQEALKPITDAIEYVSEISIEGVRTKFIDMLSSLTVENVKETLIELPNIDGFAKTLDEVGAELRGMGDTTQATIKEALDSKIKELKELEKTLGEDPTFLTDRKHFSELEAHKRQMLFFEKELAAEAVKAAEAARKAQQEILDLSNLGDDDLNGRDFDDPYSLVRATEVYNKFILDNLDKTTQEYKDLYLASVMERLAEEKDLTKEQLAEIERITKKSLENTEDFFKGVVKNFTQIVQSEMGGFFSDVLTGDLDTAEDYFKSFTSSLTSMWGAMAAKMVMNQSMWNMANFAGLGVAGLALGVVGSVLGGREKRKAKARQMAALKLQTEETIETSIAQFELSDTEYQLREISKQFEEFAEVTRATNMPLKEAVKLRRLEVEALIEQSSEQYRALSSDIGGFLEGKKQGSWTVGDWQREFGNLSDDLMSLNKTSKDYGDESIELLTDQFEILQNIYTIQETQLRALESTSQSLVAQAAGLQTSEGMPISRPYFEDRYQTLLDAALKVDPETDMLSTTDIAFFQAFVGDYIDTMSTLGDDYNILIDKATGHLLDINKVVESEMEILTKALDFNSEAVGSNTTMIANQIKQLQFSIENIALEEEFETWFASLPQIDITGLGFLDTYWNIGALHSDSEFKKYLGTTLPSVVELLEAAPEETKQTEEYEAYKQWAGEALSMYRDSEINRMVWYEEELGLFEDQKAFLQQLYDFVLQQPELPEFVPLTVDLDGGEDNDPNIYRVTQPRPIYKDDDGETISKGSTEATILQPIELVVSDNVLAKIMVDLSRSNPDIKRMLQ